ncbi:PH domain-containing protein [Patescibacteria group bacterium]|nr:PH domain-containing protein [Patescibacteria group bacterium]MBP9710126.1 PH domain-containing protein [Patescibacteria group bacterium]
MIDLRHLPNPVADEKLVFLLRRHPITVLPLAIVTLVLLASPFGINWYVQTYRPDILETPSIMAPAVLLGSTFFLFAWLFLFQYFMDYYLDTWIVTTRRIINIEQSGLFHRTMSELRLYRIQDVTAAVNGFWATIFNYGEVEIQTAGEKQRFLFEQVSDPNNISKVVIELSEADRRDHLDEAVEEFGLAEKSQKAKEKT